MARIRRSNAISPPPQLRDYIIKSEAATLAFLESTQLPTPMLHAFALAQDLSNDVGVGYIPMEKMSGKSLDIHLASEAQLKTTIEQLAQAYMEISAFPFDAMGSLDQPGKLHVGPFASKSLTDFAGDEMTLLGPFQSGRDYFRSRINQILCFIIRREMYTTRAVDAYLIHLFLLDILPQVMPESTSKHRTFLKHADDKGDQILVDEHGNITGIIDWEWAGTAPLELAFNSPLVLVDVAEFYDGVQAISKNEAYFAECLESNGGKELAEAVRGGRVRHFFTFCCGNDLEDWDGFIGLFGGLREGVGVDAGVDWNEWRERAIVRYSDDSRLQSLMTLKEGQFTEQIS